MNFQEAAAIWIKHTYPDVKAQPENILDIDFDTYQGGYCDSCAYSTKGISFRIRGGSYHTRELYVSAAEWFEEIRAIIEKHERKC